MPKLRMLPFSGLVNKPLSPNLVRHFEAAVRENMEGCGNYLRVGSMRCSRRGQLGTAGKPRFWLQKGNLAGAPGVSVGLVEHLVGYKSVSFLRDPNVVSVEEVQSLCLGGNPHRGVDGDF